MNNSERITWVDVAKGLSIILVIFLHVVQLAYHAGIPVWRLVQLNEFLADIRMPLFFAAAGLFAGRSLTLSWSELFKTKITLYIWLLLVWSVFRWIMMRYITTNPKDPDEGTDIFQIVQQFYAPDTGIWFLWALAIFFVATKFLWPIGAWGILFVSASISLALMSSMVNPEFFTRPLLDNVAYKNTARYFPFFAVSAVAPHLFLTAGQWRKFTLPLLALGYLFSYWLASKTGNPLIFGALKLLGSVAGIVGMFIFARIIEKTLIGRMIDYLGKNTLPIYVAHIPIISMAVELFLRMGVQESRAASYFSMGVGVVITIAGTLLLRRLLLSIGAVWMYQNRRLNALSRISA